MLQLRIGERVYETAAIDQITLADIATLQAELGVLAASGTPITSARTWGDVQRLYGEFSAMPKAAQQDHPEGMFLTCLTVWATRRIAGEKLGLLDAVDVPVSQIRWIQTPDDHQAADPKRRPASAPAGKRRGKPGGRGASTSSRKSDPA